MKLNDCLIRIGRSRPAVFFAVLLLAACSQSVKLTMQTEVPIPVVARLPIAVGIHYDDQFRSYVYTENSQDRPDWRIETGDSMITLFDQVLPSMFRNVSHVNSASAGGGAERLDAVISPQVEDMQFALPSETKSDVYEAWVRYKIRLFRPDGTLIADWYVTGYGKSVTELLRSRDKGLNEAMTQALRDAGARFALGFDKVEEIRAWLAEVTGDRDKYGTGS
jgi:hypothetical protein